MAKGRGNPHHDPKNGQFTSGGGGSLSSSAAGATPSAAESKAALSASKKNLAAAKATNRAMENSRAPALSVGLQGFKDHQREVLQSRANVSSAKKGLAAAQSQARLSTNGRVTVTRTPAPGLVASLHKSTAAAAQGKVPTARALGHVSKKDLRSAVTSHSIHVGTKTSAAREAFAMGVGSALNARGQTSVINRLGIGKAPKAR